jgi:hypothetical protein
MVETTQTLFATHHIDLPPTPDITPEQVRRAINTWLVKTFAREWSVAASEYPPTIFPHDAKDPFTSDDDNPDDPLHYLTPLESPRFLPGVLCGVKYCSYLAYLHPYCAACCRQKFGVEVRRTASEVGGLGLFATSKWEGKGGSSLTEVTQLHLAQPEDKVINFCTRVEYIDEYECSPFHNRRLTLDRTDSTDPYLIKYMYRDETTGSTTQIKCDATKMHFKSHNHPGLARYAVIDKRRCNVKWVKSGACTWGIRVRDFLVIEAGQEIFRAF